MMVTREVNGKDRMSGFWTYSRFSSFAKKNVSKAVIKILYFRLYTEKEGTVFDIKIPDNHSVIST